VQLLVTNQGVAPALITLSLRADPPPREPPPAVAEPSQELPELGRPRPRPQPLEQADPEPAAPEDPPEPPPVDSP